MSKVTYNKIVSKMERLDEYLQHLADIQKINKKTFVADYHFYGLAERYFQLAIEVLLDIGKLIIIAENLRRPEDNQDIFVVLADKRIISKKIANKLLGIANFRNILVHEYEDIDRAIVYQKLKHNLGDFKSFRREIKRYLV